MSKQSSHLSFSSINLYLFCPRKWYYHYRSSLPKKITYHLLFGRTIHHFIAYWLYRRTKPTNPPRPFYYKNLSSAINSWKRMWLQEVEKNQSRLILPNQEKTFAYMQIGITCLKNYWQYNHSLPRPLAIEKNFTAHLDSWQLTGTFDQIRQVSLNYIKRHRPELIKNDQLIEGYDPVVILDLKSHYSDYDDPAFSEDDTAFLHNQLSREQILRTQFDLHENLQPTIYTFLYEQATGKKPIGFVWYHLRSGKGFFTFRESKDYHNLLVTINHLKLNLAHESFPKRTGSHCRHCSFFEACHEDRDFLISPPEKLNHQDLIRPLHAPTPVKKYPGKQLKLNLKVKRRRRTTTQQPKAQPKQTKAIKLYNLPWDP